MPHALGVERELVDGDASPGFVVARLDERVRLVGREGHDAVPERRHRARAEVTDGDDEVVVVAHLVAFVRRQVVPRLTRSAPEGLGARESLGGEVVDAAHIVDGEIARLRSDADRSRCRHGHAAERVHIGEVVVRRPLHHPPFANVGRDRRRVGGQVGTDRFERGSVPHRERVRLDERLADPIEERAARHGSDTHRRERAVAGYGHRGVSAGIGEGRA